MGRIRRMGVEIWRLRWREVRREFFTQGLRWWGAGFVGCREEVGGERKMGMEAERERRED